MGKDKKRKRESHGDGEADLPPAKAQIVDKGDKPSKLAKKEKAGGDRRQIRSERKKKRELVSKENAKRKREQALATSGVNGGTAVDPLSIGQDFVSLTDNGFQKKKEKRRSPRSIRKEAREKKQLENGIVGQNIDNGAKKTGKKGAKKRGRNIEVDAGADARFICFVGNLPFTVTNEQIAAHFSKIEPKAIRISTDKKTGKGKGFAFLEFDNFDKMKTCLKLYHHSIFEPEDTKENEVHPQNSDPASKPKGRKINVELTAGGGGSKSVGRKEKIHAKNKKLNEERARDWEKKQEVAKTGKGPRTGKNDPSISDANAQEVAQNDESRGDIHPSRLSRVRG